MTEQIKIIKDLSEYLNENYFFIQPEIYSTLNKESVILFLHKKDLYYSRNTERIENLNHLDYFQENSYPREWKIFDKSKHLKWFTNEFKMKGLKYKSPEIKKALLKIFENIKFFKRLELQKEIIEVLKNERIKINGIKTIENKLERENQNFNLNEIIYFNREKSNFSNPGIIIKKISNEELKILYFTNIDKYNLETNNRKINAWEIRKVENNEIGKTPEQAKEYSYC